MKVLLSVLVPLLLMLGLALKHSSDVPSHAARSQGECASCHEDAPRWHGEQRWDVLHGQADEAQRAECETCHGPDTCLDCHDQAPATHTQAFRTPGTTDPAGALHAHLARSRPSSCLACHDSLVQDCVGCHLLQEVEPWQDEAHEVLAPWLTSLEAP